MAGGYSMCCPNCGSPMQRMGIGQQFGYGPGYPMGFGPWYGFAPPMAGGLAEPYSPDFYGQAGWGEPAFQTDEQIIEMIYDAFDADPTIPYDSDINVAVTGGVVTLTGSVPNKRVKHSAGDDAWWVPGVWDINNNIEVISRARRAEKRSERRKGHG